MKRTLEVCTGSLQSVINAVEGGAGRIELCTALPLDGLTPSAGLLQEVRRLFPKLKIHVLIRPREGDFVYTEAEIRLMIRDIEAALPYADAIVGGALTVDNRIDTDTTRRLVEASNGKPFTFHRAFDRCLEPLQAIDQLRSLGVSRVLTSGQQATAEQGIPLLKSLIERGKACAESPVIVMPGGGVTAANVGRILAETGAEEIHGSFSAVLPNQRKETCTETVRAVLKQIEGFG